MTKPAREQCAVLNLARQGFDTYLPKYLCRIGKEYKVKVLFPGYLFVRIIDKWHSINSTVGVLRLILTNENKPASLSDSIINDLKAREAEGYVVLPKSDKFSHGENVALAGGPLSGYIGVYEGMRDNERARVLIELLGRKVLLEVKEGNLKAVAVEGSGLK